MQQVSRAQIVRYSILSVIGLVVLGLVLFFIFNGFVWILTKQDDAVITVRSASGTEEERVHRSSFISTLPVGEYFVRVSSGEGSSQLKLSIRPFGFIRQEVTVNPATEIEAVSNYSMSAVNTAGGELLFIDEDTGRLQRLAGDGTLSQIGEPAMVFHGLAWSDSRRGVVIGEESGTYRVGALSDGSLSFWESPVTIDRLTIAASPDYNYALVNEQLYRAPAGTTNYTLLTTLPVGANIMTASDSSVVYFRENGEEFSLATYNLIDRSTHQVVIEKPGSERYRSSAAWSPDGKRLLVTIDGVTTLYDTSMKQLATIPDREVGQAVWESNDVVLYSATNFVYRYILSKDEITAIARSSQFLTVDTLFQPSSDEYLYLSTYSDNLTTIGRVPLKKQSVSQPASILGESNMQALGDECVIKFINHTKFTLYISGHDKETAACQSEIDNYLASINIDMALVAREITN